MMATRHSCRFFDSFEPENLSGARLLAEIQLHPQTPLPLRFASVINP
jgi:hypothetical protein